MHSLHTAYFKSSLKDLAKIAIVQLDINLNIVAGLDCFVCHGSVFTFTRKKNLSNLHQNAIDKPLFPRSFHFCFTSNQS